jgi:serine/threonine protein kinase
MAEVTLVAAGDVLGDRYVLRSQAWATPIGAVWNARDRTLERPVLVQFLDDELAKDRAAVKAFTKAAARVAQVTDPSVVQVLDIGEDPPFAVLEHAGGGRLSDRLAKGRAMEVPQAARIALSLARGLEALHARGAWHGSLAGDTVLLDAEGRAKILSIGAAETVRAAGRSAPDPSQPEGYRPPERDPIPQDADRWALAALLYHMLTGRAPARAAAPARALRRSLPPQIDHLLRRALAADQGSRPSLDEFEGALAPFARVIPSEARTPRFAASEFRWLVPVLIIVALGIAALTFGVKFATDLAHRRETRSTPSTSASVPASGQPLAIESVNDFDPPPGNGEEHSDRIDRVTDDDPDSSWATVGYSSADIGGKPGVGIILDLGATKPLARAEISTGFPGWGGEIRVANALGERATDFTKVADFTANQDETKISLPPGTRGRYVLVWITRLVNDGADSHFPWRATITDAKLFA